jgi:hypothetical protein
MTKKDAVIESDFEMSVDDMDLWMHTNIQSKWIDLEVSLFKNKWFDYRFLHPVQATLKYIIEYKRIYREIFGEVFNTKIAPYINPVKGNFLELTNKAFISGIWHGRQVADALGMPYAQFIDLALRAVLRHWRQSFMPRPCHLYDSRDIEKVSKSWEELKQARFYFSEEEEYLNGNYVGSSIQNDHHNWILDQLDQRQVKDFSIKSLIEKQLIPITKLEEKYGKTEIQSILSNV